MCPLCTNDDDVSIIGALADGRKRARCANCNFEWDHGEATQADASKSTSSVLLRGRFPKPDDITAEARTRADRLKSEFLATVRSEPDPAVAPYWAKYQQIFSADGLSSCDPQELKDFANNDTGGNLGNMSIFNSAWNDLGPKKAAAETRQVIDHLLRGEGDVEDRLTDLIAGKFAFSIPGFKEALLSKVLAVVYPDRFLTIHTYDQKASMARKVYGIDLPSPDRVNWTHGRLIVWSNDLLNSLIGDGFVDQQHAGNFLWWAQYQTV